jgi:hypothetical protein
VNDSLLTVDELEARLRNTYAHIARGVPDDLKPGELSAASRSSHRPRRAVLVLLAGLVGAGGLAVRTLQPSNSLVFTSATLTEPMVMPVDPPGFRLRHASREEIPQDDGIATVYDKPKRPRLTLKAGGLSFADEQWGAISLEGTTRVVDVSPGPTMIEVDDPICGTIRVASSIGIEALIALVPKLRCGRHDGRLRAELSDEPTSAITYWGSGVSSSSYILFSFVGMTGEADFSLMARRCECGGEVFPDAPTSPLETVRQINGLTVHFAPTTAFDETKSPLARKTVWWGTGSDVAVQMIVPNSWTWDDVEPIVGSVRAVSVQQWTNTLKPFGLEPQPQTPSSSIP